MRKKNPDSRQPLVLPNDNGIRPAGSPTQCLYCWSEVGEHHGWECVTVKKLIHYHIVVTNPWTNTSFETDLHATSPRHWTQGNLEFRYTESSYCLDNLLDYVKSQRPDLEEQVLQQLQDMEKHHACGCDHIDVTIPEDWDQPEVLVPQEVRNDIEFITEHLAGRASP